MDQEVTQQGSGGYTTIIRRLLAGFFWYRCYYPHRSRDALSPICGLFYSFNLISISSVFRGAKFTFLLTNCFMQNLKFSYFLIKPNVFF